MNLWLRTVSVLLLVCGTALASPSVPLDWSDLPDPSVQTFDDPFRDLSPEQFDDVVFVVRLRNRLQRDVGSPEERRKWQDLLIATEDALAQDRIDVDWLLDQRLAVIERRERAGQAGNPAHDGQTITLSGFAIPAPPDPDGRPVAYLVPERGMCSHIPPPPPNQMIRVRLTKGWTPSVIHAPVRLTGVLSIAPSEHQMVVVDGLMPMRATFQMDATEVEDLSCAEGAESARRLIDRILAAGHNKTGGAVQAD